jgi:hypothetical protein
MFVYRWTWRTKSGRLAEALKLVEDAAVRFWKPKKIGYRIYTSDVGPGDTMAFEMEAETEAQYADHWKRYEADDADKPATKKFWDDFNAVVDRHIMTERWTVTR